MPPGDDCTADNQCSDGYHCDDAAGTCALDVAEGGACVDDSDCGQDLYCVDLVCDTAAPEGADCSQEADCQSGLHCDAVCTVDVADGGTCDEGTDCESGNCSSSTCCSAGDCCLLDEDCPDPGIPASCDDDATCQGTKAVAQCVDFMCVTAEAPDDSGCTVDTIAVDCAPFSDLMCTGEADQAAPGECATICADSGDCGSGAGCSTNGVCEDVVCSISGSQAEIVDCPIDLARGAVGYNPAVQLQFTLDFDQSQAVPHSLKSCGLLDAPFDAFACTAEGDECAVFGNPDVYCDVDALICKQCKVIAVADAGTLVSGHTIETSYQGGELVEDQLALLFWGVESLPLNDAYLADGLVVNNSTFVTVRFQLATNVLEAMSVTINSEAGIVAPDSAAAELPPEVQHLTPPNPLHLIVTGPAPQG